MGNHAKVEKPITDEIVSVLWPIAETKVVFEHDH